MKCFTGTMFELLPAPSVQITLNTLYLLTSALSFVGNVIVIVVQLFGTESSANIRKYLINLAISDLTIGVLCVPFSYTHIVYGHWAFPVWLCPAVQFVQPLCVFVTSITLCMIGVERYTLALHPLSFIHRQLQLHARALLLLTWLLGGIYSYTLFGQTKANQFIHNDLPYYECVYNNGLSIKQRRIFMSANFVFTFLGPLIVLTYSYVAIMQRLMHSERLACGNVGESTMMRTVTPDSSLRTNQLGSHRDNSLNRTTSIGYRSRTIKIMLMVLCLYIVCWMPIKIYQFLLEFDILSFCTETQFRLFSYIYIVCHWLAMANSFVNPIIYAIMNTSFRNDFIKIFQNVLARLESHGQNSISNKSNEV